jgi:hypothetical protein
VAGALHPVALGFPDRQMMPAAAHAPPTRALQGVLARRSAGSQGATGRAWRDEPDPTAAACRQSFARVAELLVGVASGHWVA